MGEVVVKPLGGKRRNVEILYVPSAIVLMFVCITYNIFEQRSNGYCKPCFIVIFSFLC